MSTFTIKAQATNNPVIFKFETNHFITQHKSYEFKNIDEAKNAPLAKELFYLPFVKTVFISGNFIGIERYDIVTWEEVQEQVSQKIVTFLNTGTPAVIEEDTTTSAPVTIYAESTPNPGVMKFVANKKIVAELVEFKNIEQTKEAPLAQGLFHFPFVKEIFMDENYISITKYDIVEWTDITLELREFIRNYLAQGKQVVTRKFIHPEKQQTQDTSPTEQESNTTIDHNDPIAKQIIDILDEYIKPAVASDGGNIKFDSYDSTSKTVKVVLQGACSGCPSSTITLKNGIETMLKDMLKGSVEQVIAING